jgi:hypothetical protein
MYIYAFSMQVAHFTGMVHARRPFELRPVDDTNTVTHQYGTDRGGTVCGQYVANRQTLE